MEKTEYIKPFKIVKSENLLKAEAFFLYDVSQVSITNKPETVLLPHGYVILDFGKEIQGGARIMTANICIKDKEAFSADLRIRFGESLSEACSELGEKNSGNNHSPRDFVFYVSSWGDISVGNTGFRFVRIDNISINSISLYCIKADYRHCGLDYQGSFESNEKIVNEIFNTAAYTLKLCVQNNLIWDGIKRDRLVWAGDLHPEILSAFCLFGNINQIKNSLKFCKNNTSKNEWMNKIPSYSVWWVLLLCDYYLHSGDKDFVLENLSFVDHVLMQLDKSITDGGIIDFKNAGYLFWQETDMFFDWPTALTENSIAGVRALILYVLINAERLYKSVSADTLLIISLIQRIKQKDEYYNDAKQVTAFRVLAGIENSQYAIIKLLKGNAEGLSCFMSYYILLAIAQAGEGKKALEIMKEYFGGMLSKGATTFWEDFDIKWLKNSGCIDDFTKEGEKDIHGDFGKHCYKGFRHSLCHGWSSGAVPFLIHKVLGVKVLEEGCKTIKILPDLCGLEWVKGKFPTPFGIIDIKHENIKGIIKTTVKAPSEIKVVY